MVKRNLSVLREVAGNLIRLPFKPYSSMIKRQGSQDPLGDSIGPAYRNGFLVTGYTIVKTLLTGTLPEETPLLYTAAIVGGSFEGSFLTLTYDAIRSRLSRRKKKEFSIDENQIEIDELERRLTQMDNKTAIFQFSHRQTSEAMDTAYFKNMKRLPQVKKTNLRISRRF
jgi:hypothetical protein